MRSFTPQRSSKVAVDTPAPKSGHKTPRACSDTASSAGGSSSAMSLMCTLTAVMTSPAGPCTPEPDNFKSARGDPGASSSVYVNPCSPLGTTSPLRRYIGGMRPMIATSGCAPDSSTSPQSDDRSVIPYLDAFDKNADNTTQTVIDDPSSKKDNSVPVTIVQTISSDALRMAVAAQSG